MYGIGVYPPQEIKRSHKKHLYGNNSCRVSKWQHENVNYFYRLHFNLVHSKTLLQSFPLFLCMPYLIPPRVAMKESKMALIFKYKWTPGNKTRPMPAYYTHICIPRDALCSHCPQSLPTAIAHSHCPQPLPTAMPMPMARSEQAQVVGLCVGASGQPIVASAAPEGRKQPMISTRHAELQSCLMA